MFNNSGNGVELVHIATSSPSPVAAQQQQQQKQHVARTTSDVLAVDSGAQCQALGRALEAALVVCKNSGVLPVGSNVVYPSIKVQQPSAKQKKAIADNVLFTTASSLAICGVANKVCFFFFF